MMARAIGALLLWAGTMKLRVHRQSGRGGTGDLFQIESVQYYDEEADRWVIYRGKLDLGRHFSDEAELLAYLQTIFGPDAVIDRDDDENFPSYPDI